MKRIKEAIEQKDLLVHQIMLKESINVNVNDIIHRNG